MERYLSLAELAKLMGLEHESAHRRREHVRRLIRGLEKRDGHKYLLRFGPGQGKLYLPFSALEQLFPWDHGTLRGLEERLAHCEAAMRHIKRDFLSDRARITRVEKNQEIHTEVLKAARNRQPRNGA